MALVSSFTHSVLFNTFHASCTVLDNESTNDSVVKIPDFCISAGETNSKINTLLTKTADFKQSFRMKRSQHCDELRKEPFRQPDMTKAVVTRLR